MSRDLLIALDGGNSKTDALLVESDGTVLARARSGSFAPHLIGAPAAVATFSPAIEKLLAVAGDRRVGVIAGYLANADLPEEEQAIADAIAAYGWAADVVVRNDTLAMLRTGTDSATGVAVVCGGGINAVGIGSDGCVVRYPALGRVTGDWGGGYSIAKDVLWSAARAEDGRGPATILAAHAAAHFGVDTAIAVATGMHLGTIDRDRMHELVPVLFRAASAGDEIAQGLVAQQAHEIALLATNTMRRLGAEAATIDVILGGGMITARHPGIVEPVTSAITAFAPNARVVIVDAAPITGSALLGLEELDRHTGSSGAPAARRHRILTTLTHPHPQETP